MKAGDGGHGDWENVLNDGLFYKG
ncbi:hypothetical protein A2U01_0070396, partial [Trifolium medium]|nr:hypothetical protein [Trifolium medium]